MQQRRKTGLIFLVLLLFGICMGFVWAKSAVVVGMVTETQGNAYWQNDARKKRVLELAELPENAKLVIAKGSKLTLVYLASGQQYELSGPGLVQFKRAKPVALNGTMPKMIGAAAAMTGKKRIDPKSVQTAGQTLVSTEAQKDSYEPAAYAAAPPPPPPPTPAPAPALATPRLIATSPAPAKAVAKAASPAAKEQRERMQAYEAAKLAADGETAASAARESEIAAQEAARRAAEATAAKSQRRQTECEADTGNKKTDAEKDSEKSGTSMVKTAIDCPPLIIEQQN